MSDQLNAKALVSALMTQNPADKSSVAYRSGNAKFLSFAKAMSTWSPPPFSAPSGVAAVVNAYKLNTFEAAQGSQASGLQQALYFTRTASSITSITHLQSDPDLLAVAVTGIGLPLSAYDNLDFTQQTALLKQKLNVSDLQKPAYVQHLAETYVVQEQLQAGPTTQTIQPGSILSTFETGSQNSNGILSILEGTQSASSLTGTSSATNNLLSLFA